MQYRIDLNQFEKPISEKKPTGKDLRKDISNNSLYFEIKDARHHARDIERKSQMGLSTEDPSHHWDIVYKKAQEALTTQTKDLEIAVWLTEALIRQSNFDGLAEGFQLIEILITRYWEPLYPIIEDQDSDFRIAALIGLNGNESEGSLTYPLRNIIITDSKSGKNFKFWQYQQALEDQKITKSEQLTQKQTLTGFTLSEIKAAVAETGAPFYEKILDKIDSCHKTYQKITSIIDQHCGSGALPSSAIFSALEQAKDQINFLIANAPFKINSIERKPVAAIEISAKNLNSENINPKAEQGPIQTRQQALDTIKEAAIYFKQTEPHSPIPLLLERAIKWGGLSLSELLNELISNDAERTNVYKLIGIEDALKTTE